MCPLKDSNINVNEKSDIDEYFECTRCGSVDEDLSELIEILEVGNILKVDSERLKKLGDEFQPRYQTLLNLELEIEKIERGKAKFKGVEGMYLLSFFKVVNRWMISH